MRKIRYSTVSTAMGFCAFAWHDGGICRFQLPVDLEDDAKAHLLRRVPNAEHCEPGVEAKYLLEKVRAYFTGQRVEFHDTKLDIGPQSDFFSTVYDAVRAMPWGTSKTYGEIARELNAPPQAAQIVGQAMAKNPLPLLIPCHRVLAAGGKVGGFSAEGGVKTKQRMLELEGLFKNKPKLEQASLF
ncbi:methylated-DNA--[protein]-cysteine S-methyltransferase [Agrobacterium larrymoorei]|uniref:methylated-DNA--[protein]-cysteine S-methyltransferase n=1 Tax=Agrobacterium larrymoorei TaxID=160699 RepID=UPI0027D82E11|nr:methylated-DNA--[protein]-cysteine S-methyltransferase [Agrobacterium larrymoorei]